MTVNVVHEVIGFLTSLNLQDLEKDLNPYQPSLQVCTVIRIPQYSLLFEDIEKIYNYGINLS